jgi:hypothetical protein|uniref:Uncharacterized protein n=1 Tax=Panagrolaimus sp. PS1159 TaxID=55785 RepID=A0AC35FJE2_9BILA
MNSTPLYSHGQHQLDNDEELHKKQHGFIHTLKSGIKEGFDKFCGSPNHETSRSPQEILEEIKPHFVKTLNPSDDREELKKELHQQMNDDVEDVRMIQNGAKVENQYIKKN